MDGQLVTLAGVHGLGYVAALLLAAVFVRAGAAKLARPAATAASFAALGVPAPSGVARAVPFAELLTAVALIGAPQVGGAASLVFLAVFSWVLVGALRSGRAVPCNCFGTARTEPVSAVDVVRNVLLAGLAVVTLTTGREPTVASPAAVVVAAAIFAAGLLGLRTLRRRLPRAGPTS